MLKSTRLLFPFLIMILALGGILAGCGSSVNDANQKGRLVFSITDAPGDAFHEVHVAISRIEANRDGEWTKIADFASEPYQVNLMDLRLTSEKLADAYIPAGHYSQIRLILDDTAGMSYVTLKTAPDEKIDLKVPSGEIKVNYDFTIEPNKVVGLMMDIDAGRFPHPNGKGYIMNPTAIRMIDMIEGADVKGTVIDGNDPSAVTNPDYTLKVVATNAELGLAVETTAVSGPVEDDTAGDFILRGLAKGDWVIKVQVFGADNEPVAGYNVSEKPVTVVGAGVTVDAGGIELTMVEATVPPSTDDPAAE